MLIMAKSMMGHGGDSLEKSGKTNVHSIFGKNFTRFRFTNFSN